MANATGFYGAEIQHGNFFFFFFLGGGWVGYVMCIPGIKNSLLRGHELTGDGIDANL